MQILSNLGQVWNFELFYSSARTANVHVLKKSQTFISLKRQAQFIANNWINIQDRILCKDFACIIIMY